MQLIRPIALSGNVLQKGVRGVWSRRETILMCIIVSQEYELNVDFDVYSTLFNVLIMYLTV